MSRRAAERCRSQACAEYLDGMLARTLTEHDNPALDFFPGVHSVAELARLSPEAFLAAYLEGQDPKPENYDDGRPPVLSRTVIGAVSEADSLAEVVYRIHTDAGRFGEAEAVDVITVRRTPVGWRILLNRDLSQTSSIRIFRRGGADDR